MEKIWQLAGAPPAEYLSQFEGINPLILGLLYERGLKSREEVEEFLNPSSLEFFSEGYLKKYDPFLFKDMAPAVEKIISYIKAGEKIMIYGDYDADGVTASTLLFEILSILKAKVDIYLPNRVTEGYGLNKVALEKISQDGFKLIITVDTATRNKEEVIYGQSLGLDFIITDHHALPEEESDLPPCLFINCANQKEAYPVKNLAGVGVAFKLATALVMKSTLSQEDKKKILERELDVLAIGTISDLVALLSENRLLTNHGLMILNRYKRLGLLELIKAAGLNPANRLDAWSIGFQIGPRLNSASRLEHANTALALLLSKDEREAEALALDLNQKNASRQKITEEIVAEVEKQITEKGFKNIIFGVFGGEEEDSWSEGVIGLVAGRISEKYYRPTLIITKTKDGYKGSGRSVEEFNLIEAIESLSEVVDKYGGHPMAAGFSLYSDENLEKFLFGLEKIAEEKLAGLNLQPKLKLDAVLDLKELKRSFLEELDKLAPYGQHNPQPRFASYNLSVLDKTVMGSDKQHVKFRLSQADDPEFHSFPALAFNKAKDYEDINPGDMVNLAYYLEINGFNGRSEIQLKIIDIKKL